MQLQKKNKGQRVLPLRQVAAATAPCLPAGRRLRVTRWPLFFLPLLFVPTIVLAAEAQEIAQYSSRDFANGLYARKMYGPAISEYEKVIQTNPAPQDLASARFRIADSHYFLKDYKQAVEHFNRFTRDFPRDQRKFIAFFRLANSKLNLKDTSSSAKIFSMLSKEAPDPNIQAGSLFHLAKIETGRGRHGEARALLQKLLKKFPQTEYAAYAALIAGDSYTAEEKYEDAIAAYRVAAERPMPPEIADEASYKLAELSFAQKNYPVALDFYRKLYEKEKTSASRGPFFEKTILGILYCEYQRKDLDSAVALLNENAEFLNQSPLRHEAHYLLAGLYFEKKEYTSALEILNRLLKDPQTPPAVIPKAFFTRAEILSEMGRWQEAAADYQASLEGADDDTRKAALYNLAGVNLNAGLKAEARGRFMEFAKKYPRDEDTQRAYLQAVQIDLDLSDLEKAATLAREFIREYPQSRWSDVAFYKLGMAMTGLSRPEEAAQAFRYVVSQYPESPLYVEALYGTAAGLENAGLPRDAGSFYQKLVDEFPSHALAAEALPHLAYLYVQSGEFDQAAELTQKMLLTRPEAPVTSKTALWLIQYLLDRSRYDEMRQILSLLPQKFPKEPLSHETNFFLAESAMGLKDTARAREYYAQAIEASPEGAYTPHAYLGLGIAAAVDNDIPAAELNFSKAARFDQIIDVALRAKFELANLRLKTGDLAEAAKAFMMVAVLYDDPKLCSAALAKAGECYQKLGQTEDAEKAFAELKTRYPESEWAAQLPADVLP